MYFTKFTRLFLAVATSAASAQAGLTKRDAPAALSVVFYDKPYFTGASYSPPNLMPHKCVTLPDEWKDRAESITVSAGYVCIFYYRDDVCHSSTYLLRDLDLLPAPLFKNIKSFDCLEAP